MGDEPLTKYPLDLQTKKRELVRLREDVTRQIEDIDQMIVETRRICEHAAIPGTEDHYAVYCRKCGHMMDTWL